MRVSNMRLERRVSISSTGMQLPERGVGLRVFLLHSPDGQLS